MRLLFGAALGVISLVWGFQTASADPSDEPKPRVTVQLDGDQAPAAATTGQPVTIGFMVLNGFKCINGVLGQPLNPYLEAENSDTGELVRVDADENRELHYVVTVVFPSAGE
jgi:hypothetical protein